MWLKESLRVDCMERGAHVSGSNKYKLQDVVFRGGMLSELWSTILSLLILNLNFNPPSASPWIVQVILNNINERVVVNLIYFM